MGFLSLEVECAYGTKHFQYHLVYLTCSCWFPPKASRSPSHIRGDFWAEANKVWCVLSICVTYKNRNIICSECQYFMRLFRILDNRDHRDTHLASFLLGKMGQSQILLIRNCFKTQNLGFTWRADLVTAMVFADPRNLSNIHTWKRSSVEHTLLPSDIL